MQKASAFISYRREDTAGYAGRLYDRLNAKFPERIFMDVSGLDPGVDFVEEIQKAVGSCRALIVLIGKHWSISAEGTPRLQDPGDFVRLEVAHALERKIRVIPVLVGRANIPAEDTLPPEIHPLVRRQALKLDDTAFDYHVNQLIEVLEKDLGPAIRPTAAGVGAAAQPAREQRPAQTFAPLPAAQPKKTRRWLWLGLGAAGAVALLVLGLIGYIVNEFSNASVDPQATQVLVDAIQKASNANSSSPAGSPAVVNQNPPGKQSEPPAPSFNPVGRWQITGRDGFLVASFESTGEFVAQTVSGGLSIPASAGSWTYNPTQRLLTVTGVNNRFEPFQVQFQNIRHQDGRFHATVPGSGEVELVKQ
jgi:TIR domain